MLQAARLRVLRVGQREQWMEVLGRVARHDYFHLPGCHELAERYEGGSARLVVYELGEHLIALPLLLRPLGEIAALGDLEEDWQDATSVYGYVGPVASEPSFPEIVIADFQHRLCQYLQQEKVVTLFTRLNPLLEQEKLLVGVGRCLETGETVSIDLRLEEQEQRKRYRLNHRRGISKLQRMGVSCAEDERLEHLEEFAAIYAETMERVEADRFYEHDATYFRELHGCEPGKGHLFVARHGGRMIAGLYVLENHGLIQCHLGGTLREYLAVSPMKLLFDTVRHWGWVRGCDRLHLGGGVGSCKDSLFHFKSGFSDQRHSFRCWRWALYPQVYKRLCRVVAAGFGKPPRNPGFFPYYRLYGRGSDRLVG